MSDETDDPREGRIHPRRRTVLSGHRAGGRALLRRYRVRPHAPRLADRRAARHRQGDTCLSGRALPAPSPRSAAGSADLEPRSSAPTWWPALVAARSHPDLSVVERRFDAKTKRIKARSRPTMPGWPVRFCPHGGRTAAGDVHRGCRRRSQHGVGQCAAEDPRGAAAARCSSSSAISRVSCATIRSRCMRLDLAPLSRG